MSGIYALPSNPSVVDIIERSLIAHPSLFVDALTQQAQMHAEYSRTTNNVRARQGADASERACERAAEFAEREDLPARERAACIAAETGPAVLALNVAGKLQCLPRHMLTAAAVALDNEPVSSILGAEWKA